MSVGKPPTITLSSVLILPLFFFEDALDLLAIWVVQSLRGKNSGRYSWAVFFLRKAVPYYFWTASNLQVASCTDRKKNISASSFPILMNLAASRLQSLSCWTSLSFEKQLESETASIVIPSQPRCFPHCMSCFSVYDKDGFGGLQVIENTKGSKSEMSNPKTIQRVSWKSQYSLSRMTINDSAR